MLLGCLTSVGVVLGAVLTPAVDPGKSSIDLTLARQYFAEARALADRDAGKLWGVSLAGPLLLVEPQTRALVANQADAEGRLKRLSQEPSPLPSPWEGEGVDGIGSKTVDGTESKAENGVFVGMLPAEETYAATAKTWAGVDWAMFLWPLPEDARERRRLLAHESWHRVQARAGFPAAMSADSHLDTADGRIWLQLEWRALAAALQKTGDERRQAVVDALVFRAYRRVLFPTAGEEERAMEMHEGLAEYTGVRLCDESSTGQREMTLKNHAAAKGWPTLVFSFAYVSGPSYGLLLDELKPDWRKGLTPRQDLGRMLQEALAVTLPADMKAAALDRAQTYDGALLMAAEAARKQDALVRQAQERRRFVEGPVLVIFIQAMQFQFDPRDVHPLDDLGKVYPKMRMTDAWGVLEVTGGALISADWSRVTVPAPEERDARPLKGDGWTLELKENWRIVAGNRAGDCTLRSGGQ